MDVSVDSSGGDDVSLCCDDLGASTDDHGVFFSSGWIGNAGADAALDAGISGMADADDASGADAEIGFDDAKFGIDDGGVGEDEVE